MVEDVGGDVGEDVGGDGLGVSPRSRSVCAPVAAAAGPSGVQKKSSRARVEGAAPGENASSQKAARVGVAGARPAMGSVAAPMVATFERVVSESEAGGAPVLFARLADSLFA